MDAVKRHSWIAVQVAAFAAWCLLLVAEKVCELGLWALLGALQVFGYSVMAVEKPIKLAKSSLQAVWDADG